MISAILKIVGSIINIFNYRTKQRKNDLNMCKNFIHARNKLSKIMINMLQCTKKDTNFTKFLPEFKIAKENLLNSLELICSQGSKKIINEYRSVILDIVEIYKDDLTNPNTYQNIKKVYKELDKNLKKDEKC